MSDDYDESSFEDESIEEVLTEVSNSGYSDDFNEPILSTSLNSKAHENYSNDDFESIREDVSQYESDFEHSEDIQSSDRYEESFISDVQSDQSHPPVNLNLIHTTLTIPESRPLTEAEMIKDLQLQLRKREREVKRIQDLVVKKLDGKKKRANDRRMKYIEEMEILKQERDDAKFDRDRMKRQSDEDRTKLLQAEARVSYLREAADELKKDLEARRGLYNQQESQLKDLQARYAQNDQIFSETIETMRLEHQKQLFEIEDAFRIYRVKVEREQDSFRESCFQHAREYESQANRLRIALEEEFCRLKIEKERAEELSVFADDERKRSLEIEHAWIQEQKELLVCERESMEAEREARHMEYQKRLHELQVTMNDLRAESQVMKQQRREADELRSQAQVELNKILVQREKLSNKMQKLEILEAETEEKSMALDAEREKVANAMEALMHERELVESMKDNKSVDGSTDDHSENGTLSSNSGNVLTPRKTDTPKREFFHIEEHTPMSKWSFSSARKSSVRIPEESIWDLDFVEEMLHFEV